MTGVDASGPINGRLAGPALTTFACSALPCAGICLSLPWARDLLDL
jgi:hypothetical protein